MVGVKHILGMDPIGIQANSNNFADDLLRMLKEIAGLSPNKRTKILAQA